MVRLSVFAAMLALSAMMTNGAAAQQPPASGEAQDDIVVTGQRTEEAIRNFIDQMAVAPRADNQLARWDRRICPGIAGLRARYAQFLIDRMAQRALQVDLDVGAPGCRANILIVVAPDPDAVARDLFEHHPAAMGYLSQRGRRSLGRRALRAWVESDAPVRWWLVSHAVKEDGDPIGESPTDGNPMSASRGAPVVNVMGNSSRLSRPTHQDFGAAYIIVDANRLSEINFDWAALADYLTMISLAQIDAEADTSGYPTILNLFASRTSARPDVMTEWDVAYLRGLYSATRDARSSAQQEGEISRSMQRELGAPPPR